MVHSVVNSLSEVTEITIFPPEDVPKNIKIGDATKSQSCVRNSCKLTCMIDVFPTPGAPKRTTLSSLPSLPLPPFAEELPPRDGAMADGLGSDMGLS